MIMKTNAEGRPVGMDRMRLKFSYDYLGRRTGKKVWTGVTETNDTSGTLQTQRVFVYDGFNLIAEQNGTAVPFRTYSWGLDLSGSVQGAGGVGGLLSIQEGTQTYLTACDGNGNLMALLDGATGDIEAAYEYGPYGEKLRASGIYADQNPFRYSTKYFDNETGLYYYGFRYYSPSQGRFINRDPFGETGGQNLYAFVGNDPVNRWDVLGLVIPVLEEFVVTENRILTENWNPFGYFEGPISAEHLTDPVFSLLFQLMFFFDDEIENLRNQVAEAEDERKKRRNRCLKEQAKLSNRKKNAEVFKVRLFGFNGQVFSPTKVVEEVSGKDVAAAAGLVVGYAGGISNVTGAGGGNVLGPIGLFFFSAEFGDKLGTALGEGAFGTRERRIEATNELLRTSFVFGASSGVGAAIAKVPTPVTIFAGTALATGGVGIRAFERSVIEGHINDLNRFLDVFSGTGTISFTEKTQPEYLFRTLLPQCVSIMARLP